MIKEEVTIKSEKIYEGKILNLRVDTIELPDKRYSKREVVEHSGGVGVVAITEDDEIILVNQYRKAVNKALLEIPAGKLELNEQPKETAIRELKEETGYSCEEASFLANFFPTPGYCSEKIHIFFAKGLEAGDQDLDENEIIDVIKIPFDEAYEKVLNGEIVDGKTIIGIFMAKLEREKNV